MRTIRVTGKGQIKVRPDVTGITMTLSRLDQDYGGALRRSAEDTEILKDALAAFDFARTDLKTLSFNVDAEYEGYQDRDGSYRQRFVGYRFRHLLKLEFASDNERLGRILCALAQSTAEPELRISYTVSDPEAAKNELLDRAVADAKEKAAVLARAAGVALKEIQSIDYSWGEINFEARPMADGIEAKRLMAANSVDLDLEPDDIRVSDTVTVLWEIG